MSVVLSCILFIEYKTKNFYHSFTVSWKRVVLCNGILRKIVRSVFKFCCTMKHDGIYTHYIDLLHDAHSRILNALHIVNLWGHIKFFGYNMQSKFRLLVMIC